MLVSASGLSEAHALRRATSWRAPPRTLARRNRALFLDIGRHAGSAGSRPYPGEELGHDAWAAHAARPGTGGGALSPALSAGFHAQAASRPVRQRRLCAALALWAPAATAAADGRRRPAPPTAAASETANGDARDCAPTERAGGKVIDIYWTHGPDHGRITSGEVDHYVDLNLVVRTRGYLEGDCVEATVQAADGGDIVEAARHCCCMDASTRRGRLLQEPLRRYTLILSDSDKDAPEQDAPGSRPAP